MSRHHRHADLDNPFAWAAALFKLAVVAVICAAWLAWVVVAVPVAGVAKVARRDEFARRAFRSIGWDFLFR
jgi:hypothetical protein